MKNVAIGGLIVVALIMMATIAGLLLILFQGKRAPIGDPQYVALGSSFAAGIGLGARAPGSPIACMRTLNSYPQQVSRLLNLPLVDVTCSGATTAHILKGGQFFQRAQLDALRPETRLVTITSGGNDIHYVGDLSFIAARNAPSVSGWLMRRFWSGPLQPSQRDYTKVRRDLAAVVSEVRIRSPHALVVIVTYPAILPPSGTCPRLNISQDEADSIRDVGEQLAAATRAAARDSHAVLVDMQGLAIEHHACSPTPWTNGWLDARGTQFHPTLAGARAMAEAVVRAVHPRP
jgi:lysophospholipase L1-like esterase